MSVFALFEDGTASELLVACNFSDKRQIDIDVIHQENREVKVSARNGVISAYHILIAKDILEQDEGYYVSVGFSGMDLRVTGESAGLAVLLGFVEKVCQRKKRPLPFSAAATGVVSDFTAEAKIEGIKGINDKLLVASEKLKKGDKIFYPKENEGEIDERIRKEIEAKQIELIPVSTAKEAIERFLNRGGDSEPPRKKKGSLKYILLLLSIIVLAVAGYNLGLKKYLINKPLTFQTIKFHYFTPTHHQFNLLEDETPEVVLKSGNEYQFEVKPNTECYLYIYQLDSANRLYCLFPNPRYSSIINPLKENISYWIPSERKRFYLDENVGEERFYLIASTRPLKGLGERIKARRGIEIKVALYKEFKLIHR
jgi:hypothetical protein